MDLQLIRSSFKAAVMAMLMLGTTFGITYGNQAWAWGANGHRIIGAIAEQHLTPEAKAQVMAILQGQSLARASTWADEMRSAPGPFWQRQSSRWHYINIDSQHEFLNTEHRAHIDKTDIKDAYSAILSAMSALSKADTSATDKQFYLRFLIHLIGDIHQPLHVGRSADRGGNRINVEFFSQVTNLHRLWDTQLIAHQQLSYSEYKDFICCTQTQVAQNQTVDVKGWLLESHHLANKIYSHSDERLGYEYVYQYQTMMEQQLRRGGLRLAALLNHLYQGTAA
ncbi:S1/P1 nuclease [Pseudoalteromonas sp. BDTF-M6]|uniref:S1/P1 nuclease n=1 Tax=Pseudoalteromonas sp. BDTF-M6 TaxID=2796132 RepID=UPI00201699C0|nr:S1/P1 nuclease [Pseudoalteromonas sp. BDTF-M6]